MLVIVIVLFIMSFGYYSTYYYNVTDNEIDELKRCEITVSYQVASFDN